MLCRSSLLYVLQWPLLQGGGGGQFGFSGPSRWVERGGGAGDLWKTQ